MPIIEEVKSSTKTSVAVTSNSRDKWPDILVYFIVEIDRGCQVIVEGYGKDGTIK